MNHVCDHLQKMEASEAEEEISSRNMLALLGTWKSLLVGFLSKLHERTSESLL